MGNTSRERDGGHLPLKAPPRRGPAIAEQLQVTLSAWDHFARDLTSTISDVIVQTRLTIPPPPTPASARAKMSHNILCHKLLRCVRIREGKTLPAQRRKASSLQQKSTCSYIGPSVGQMTKLGCSKNMDPWSSVLCGRSSQKVSRKVVGRLFVSAYRILRPRCILVARRRIGSKSSEG